MKTSISFLILFLTLLLSAAEPQKSELPLRLKIPLNNKNDTLFIERDSHKILNALQLKSLHSFIKTKDGWLAQAQNNEKKWGYINPQGKWVFKPILDKAKAFSEDNIARVYRDNKWGFVKSDGSFLIEPRFNDVSPFQQGLAAVQEQKGDDYYYINSKGEKAFQQQFCRAQVFSDIGLAAIASCPTIPVYTVSLDKVEKTTTNGKENWGYINTKGDTVIKPQYKRADTFNKFSVASIRDSANNSKLINVKGELVVDTAFEYLWGFSESGVAWSESTGEDKYTGYIDTKGKRVWEASYHDFSGEHNGLLVNHRNGFQVFDPFGKLIIKEKSTWVDTFQDSQASIARRDGKWGILSRDGSFKTFPENIIAPLTDSNGYVSGLVEGIVAMLNKDREVIYFDKNTNTQFKLAANGNNTMTLYDKNHKAIWDSGIKEQKIEATLARGVFEHFKDSDDSGEGIIKTVEQLLKSEPRKYHIPNPLYRRDGQGNDPYDLSQDIDELKKGAIKIVASTYVSEAEWGSYYFLSRDESASFRAYKKQMVSLITNKYGEPTSSKSYRTRWKIGDKVLKLESLNDSGDGDFYHQLILEVNEDE